MEWSRSLARRMVFISSLIVATISCYTAVLADQLTVSWTNTATQASGVKINRKTGATGTYALVATVGATATSYTDAGLAAGTTYCYQLQAFNSTTTSASSQEACTSTLGQVPTVQAIGASAVSPSSGSSVGPSSSLITSSSPSPGSLTKLAKAKIGIFRPSTGKWRLDLNGNGMWDGCQVDGCLESFGQQGQLPVIGDWIGTRIAQIGVFDVNTGLWKLDRNGNDLWDGCSADLCLGSFGNTGGLPVVGHWKSTSNIDRIGLFRPGQRLWQLDLNGNGVWDGCQVDGCLGPFGNSGDLPVVGDWNGAGITKIGVFDPHTGLWELDLNGNGVWDGCQVDGCLGPFGQSGDLPVAGSW